MSLRNPDFDIDAQIGAQSELWVSSIQKLFAEGNGAIEVKAPKPFLKEQSAYIEYECRGRDGVWRPSGIATTKAKAWVLTFGSLPGGLIVETEWLKRAAQFAFRRGQKKECPRGSNPTRGVFVSLQDFWDSREHNP